MTLEVVSLAPDEDPAEFLAVRHAVDPDAPLSREAFEERRARSGRVDLLARLDGRCIGVASAEPAFESDGSAFAFARAKVLEEERGRGIGTALFRAVSEHAASIGKSGLHVPAREDDEPTLAYLYKRGFEVASVMRQIELELEDADLPGARLPPGLELVSLERPGLERALHAAAVEAEADVPTPERYVVPTLEQWLARTLPPTARRDLSFAALESDGTVAGYAILGIPEPGRGASYMTAVRSAWRGRGLATALKTAQILAAREAGLERLMAFNDERNAPMRRVNEKLGYRPLPAYLQLRGPLLL